MITTVRVDIKKFLRCLTQELNGKIAAFLSEADDPEIAIEGLREDIGDWFADKARDCALSAVKEWDD